MEEEKVLNPLIFTHEEFGKIRILGDWENPEFCLADICRSLELRVDGVVARLKGDPLTAGVLSKKPIQTAGGIQQMYFVNEAGLYEVILDSRKPSAKKFRKWVMSEVLPSIRKTGSYTMPGHEQPERVVHIHFDVNSTINDENSNKWLDEKKGEELGRIARMLGNTNKLNTAQKYLMNEAVHSLTGRYIPTMSEFTFDNYYGTK